MAKAKNLAALAGLAGLAYAMRNKGDSSTTDTGDETERLAKRGESRRQITDYMKKAPEAEDANYGNEGRRTSMGVSPTPKSAPKTTTKVAPTTKTSSTSDARNLEAGMSRGTRTVPNNNYSNEGRSSTASAKNSDYSNEGRSSIAPSKSASTSSSSEQGMSNYKPRRTPSSSTDPREAEAGMSRGTRKTSMAGAGRGFVNPPVPAPKDPREAEAGMSRGTRTTAPPFKGGQRGYDEAGNFMGGQRGFDEAGNPMKKGGMVKKMASGGMTASRRADGIATKGKTRGKIC
jgi:hypothetical protein